MLTRFFFVSCLRINWYIVSTICWYILVYICIVFILNLVLVSYAKVYVVPLLVIL